MSWSLSRLLRRASLLLLLCILARVLTSSLFDLEHPEPQMLPHFRVVRGNSSSLDDVSASVPVFASGMSGSDADNGTYTLSLVAILHPKVEGRCGLGWG